MIAIPAEELTVLDQLRQRVIADPADTLLAEAVELLEDYERSFDLRWNADMRAIKRWQAAAPGRELTWPDHADLCVWLMEQLDPTPGAPARSEGKSDATISTGSADHGEALAPGVDQPRP